MIPWREHDEPQNEHITVWSTFPADTEYFAPGQATFMINYIVDDLDAMIHDRAFAEGRRKDCPRAHG